MKKILLIAIFAAFAGRGFAQPSGSGYSGHWYERVALFSSEAPVSCGDIVFLGDSLTEGGNWSELLGWENIRNRGVVGDTASGIYDRLEQIVVGGPAKIFLMVGVNDISHNLSADSVVSVVMRVVERIVRRSPHTKLVLQSLLPFDESFGRYSRLAGKTNMIPEINAQLAPLARRQGVQFLDLFPLFAIPGTNTLRGELTGDGLHLNAKGYAIWAEALRDLR